MPKNKIIIADDHPLVRVGIKELLHQDPALTVVGEAGDGEQLLELLSVQKCDLCIVDISMPKMDGLAAIREIRQRYPRVKILILSMMKDYYHFHEMMSTGALGYMVKDDAPEQLILAIRTILKGKRYVSSSVTKVLVDREIRSLDEGEMPSLGILTGRERQILAMIAKGMANKKIAAKLNISVRTVEHHRANLTDKLGVKDTASLVKYAIAKDLT
ncbi:MAG: response regulator transcription factor [Candidatus Omnitrophica bacterium]|nr:response regulator transcription factor [Candidatus Omnitrophota bacterium]